MSVEGGNIANVNDPVEKKLVYPDEEVSVFNKEKLLPENSEDNKDISKSLGSFLNKIFNIS